ncbi:MAG: hypothetical protein SVR94_09685 [Pseudomonadota bacterium]|nr:hypothetical protein [Pseudomonadota bacterium]
MNTIMTSLSRVTTTLRQYTYPIAVGCLFAFTQFMPAVNAQTTSDFEEMPVLTEEDFDLPDSGRYLVKLNPISADEPMIKPSEDMESGVSLGAVEEDLKAALKNYPEATITPLMAGNSVADAQALSSNDSPLANVYVVEVSSDVDPEAFIDELSSYPFVEYAEQDGVAFATDITPNDPYFRYQWGLQNIKAPEAWQCTGKEDEIVIAVLDTGVYYYHEDLSGKVIRGYDFAENDPYPYDRHTN